MSCTHDTHTHTHREREREREREVLDELLMDERLSSVASGIPILVSA
jgi:hypothetical protein